MPQKATMRIAAIHIRCTTHPGIAKPSPMAKNGPIGNR